MTDVHPWPPTGGATRPVVQAVTRYRFVVADAALADTGAGRGLLQLSPPEQLEAFDRLTRDGGSLVVVCHDRQASAARRAGALARSRSDLRLAVVPVPLAPGGQQRLVDLAQDLLTLGTGRPVAELAAWLPVAARALVDVGVVGSVARLDHPGVGVAHHALSLLPGRRQFLAQLTPLPAVGRATRKGVLRTTGGAVGVPSFAAAFGAVATVAGPRPVPEALLRALGTGTPSAAPVPAAAAAFWRDPQATELVVTPADVGGWTVAQLPPLEPVPCGWCDELLTRTMPGCPFCGHTSH